MQLQTLPRPRRRRVREAQARAQCGVIAVRESAAGDSDNRRAHLRLACGLFLQAAALLDTELAIVEAGLERDDQDSGRGRAA